MNSKPLYIKNSLTGRKELFVPLVDNNVGMYVCGPTVYGEPHLGHARSAITFDVVYRYFTFLGYKVRYVRNVTDVGHLEDELNGEGEDKIAKKARIEQVEPMEVAQHYTNLYRDMMNLLNVRRPSVEPVASGHIPEQIAIVERIVNNGLAYEVNGSVYLNVQAYLKKYPYGELSGHNPTESFTGSRVQAVMHEKQHAADFALWKRATAGHLMQWESPWGMGYPGWHVECTAMSRKYLGLPFDIHGGGMDLKFPHHEAEIAQCFAAFDCQPVNYWMHNNMMTLEGQKMAKSKGNFISLSQLFSGDHPLLEKAYSPMSVRFLMLQAHYGSPIDFSNSALLDAETACQKLLHGLKLLKDLSCTSSLSMDEDLTFRILKISDACFSKMNDDFNTAETIACLFELLRIIHRLNEQRDHSSVSEKTLEILKKTYSGFLVEVLGIKEEKETESSVLPEVMNIILELRRQAKEEGNFALSDSIRNQLEAVGIHIRDNKNGHSAYQIKFK